MRTDRRHGFTLVEFLVVIGIIALLIGVLLPALQGAREQANKVKCAANLRSIGQGLHLYTVDYKGSLPAAYIYAGMKIDGVVQTPPNATAGYVHWSSFIYSDKSKAGMKEPYMSKSGWDAFQCPSLDNGGLPPTNTYPENLDSGQSNESGSVVDQQAPRMSYTVNEAVCPRNKFVPGFQGAVRRYSYVNAGKVRNGGSTILATEFVNDWRAVSGDSRGGGGGGSVSKSHRPVHGFIGLDETVDMDQVPLGTFSRPAYRRCTKEDVLPTQQLSGNTIGGSRLNWVGRNHGKKGSGGKDLRQSNFLYVDGHVESKSVFDTVEAGKFEWGEKFYTLVPNNDIVN